MNFEYLGLWVLFDSGKRNLSYRPPPKSKAWTRGNSEKKQYQQPGGDKTH